MNHSKKKDLCFLIVIILKVLSKVIVNFLFINRIQLNKFRYKKQIK